MANCNRLYIDTQGLMNAIYAACEQQLDDIANQIIQRFQLYIAIGGAGRHEWRENAGKEFHVLSQKQSNDVMTVELGIDTSKLLFSQGNYYAQKIMVALFGNHPPQGTKPGQQTFHDQMDDIRESRAQGVHDLPQFDWPDPHADQMLENVFKMTERAFLDGIDRLLDNIDFSNYVHVA